MAADFGFNSNEATRESEYEATKRGCVVLDQTPRVGRWRMLRLVFNTAALRAGICNHLMNSTILVVEDDENDVFLMERALRKASVPAQVPVVRDGREALRYLRGEGDYADRQRHPLPCLTLLDLNLPHVHGLEVLKQIREDPRLRKLIVVVLTSSIADSDIERAYELGANSYLSKPNYLEEGEKLAELIGQYWLNRNRLPKSGFPGSVA